MAASVLQACSTVHIQLNSCPAVSEQSSLCASARLILKTYDLVRYVKETRQPVDRLSFRPYCATGVLVASVPSLSPQDLNFPFQNLTLSELRRLPRP